MRPLISVVILAAGKSERMSKLKQLMPFRRGAILEQSIDNFLNSEVHEVIVVAGHRAEQVIKTVATKPVKIAINPMYQQGMSTSIIAGLNLVEGERTG